MSRCDGCKHNLYSAPNGQLGFPGGDPMLLEPHSRCLLLNVYIPMVIEKKKGCDGTTSAVWVRSEKPIGCPSMD